MMRRVLGGPVQRARAEGAAAGPGPRSAYASHPRRLGRTTARAQPAQLRRDNEPAAGSAAYIVKGSKFVPTSHLLKGLPGSERRPVFIDVETLHPDDVSAQRDVLALRAARSGLTNVHLLTEDDTHGSPGEDVTSAPVGAAAATAEAQVSSLRLDIADQLTSAANAIAQRVEEKLAYSTERDVALHDERTVILADAVARVLQAELQLLSHASAAEGLATQQKLSDLADAVSASVADAVASAELKQDLSTRAALQKLATQLGADIESQIAGMSQKLQHGLQQMGDTKAAGSEQDLASALSSHTEAITHDLRAALVEAVDAATKLQLQALAATVNDVTESIAGTVEASLSGLSDTLGKNSSAQAPATPPPAADEVIAAMENALNTHLDALRSSVAQDVKKALSKYSSDKMVERVAAILEQWRTENPTDRAASQSLAASEDVLAELQNSQNENEAALRGLQHSIKELSNLVSRLVSQQRDSLDVTPPETQAGAEARPLQGTHEALADQVRLHLEKISAIAGGIDDRLAKSASIESLEAASSDLKVYFFSILEASSAARIEDEQERFVRLAQVISDNVQASLVEQLPGRHHAASAQPSVETLHDDTSAAKQITPDLLTMVLQETLSAELGPVLSRLGGLEQKLALSSEERPTSSSESQRTGDAAVVGVTACELSDILDNKLLTLSQVVAQSVEALLAQGSGPSKRAEAEASEGSSAAMALQETAQVLASSLKQQQAELVSSISGLKTEVIDAVRDEMGQVHQVDFTPVSEFIDEMKTAVVAYIERQNQSVLLKVGEMSEALSQSVVKQLVVQEASSRERDVEVSERLRATIEGALKSSLLGADHAHQAVAATHSETRKALTQSISELRDDLATVIRDTIATTATTSSPKDVSVEVAASVAKVDVLLERVAAMTRDSAATSNKLVESIDGLKSQVSALRSAAAEQVPALQGAQEPAGDARQRARDMEAAVTAPILRVLQSSRSAEEAQLTALRGVVTAVHSSVKESDKEAASRHQKFETDVMAKLASIEALIASHRSPVLPEKAQPASASDATVAAATAAVVAELGEMGRRIDSLHAVVERRADRRDTAALSSASEKILSATEASRMAVIERLDVLMSKTAAAAEGPTSPPPAAWAALDSRLDAMEQLLQRPHTVDEAQWLQLEKHLASIKDVVGGLSASTAEQLSSGLRESFARLEELVGALPERLAHTVKHSAVAEPEGARSGTADVQLLSRIEELLQRFAGGVTATLAVRRREDDPAQIVDRAVAQIVEVVQSRVRAMVAEVAPPQVSPAVESTPRDETQAVAVLLESQAKGLRESYVSSLREVRDQLEKRLAVQEERAERLESTLSSEFAGQRHWMDTSLSSNLLHRIDESVLQSEKRQRDAAREVASSHETALTAAVGRLEETSKHLSDVQESRIREAHSALAAELKGCISGGLINLDAKVSAAAESYARAPSVVIEELGKNLGELRHQLSQHVDQASLAHQREMEKLLKVQIESLHMDIRQELRTNVGTTAVLTAADVSDAVQREQRAVIKAIEQLGSTTGAGAPAVSHVTTGSDADMISKKVAAALQAEWVAQNQAAMAAATSGHSSPCSATAAVVDSGHPKGWLANRLWLLVLEVIAVFFAVLAAMYLVFAAFLVAFVGVPPPPEDLSMIAPVATAPVAPTAAEVQPQVPANATSPPLPRRVVDQVLP